MGFPVTLTSFSKLVEESLVTNYVREEYVTKSKNYSEKKKVVLCLQSLLFQLLLARVLKVLPLLLARQDRNLDSC